MTALVFLTYRQNRLCAPTLGARRARINEAHFILWIQTLKVLLEGLQPRSLSVFHHPMSPCWQGSCSEKGDLRRDGTWKYTRGCMPFSKPTSVDAGPRQCRSGSEMSGTRPQDKFLQPHLARSPRRDDNHHGKARNAIAIMQP